MRFLALLIVVLLSAAPSRAADLDHKDLSIVTAGGQTYHFDVEVAQTPEQQQRGLMFRKGMAPDAGMIFPFERDTTTSFWMRNTLIPLDMLFVAGDGSIKHIAPDATPLSDAEIPSGYPVRMVIELNGGTAAKFGIHVGDKVVLAQSGPVAN